MDRRRQPPLSASALQRSTLNSAQALIHKSRSAGTRSCSDFKRTHLLDRQHSEYRAYSLPQNTPENRNILNNKMNSGSRSLERKRSRSGSPHKSKTPNMKSRNQLSRAYRKKKDSVELKDGEVFSPFLWRKFHINDHMFDFSNHEDELTLEEIQDNVRQMKQKYPHLTKYFKSDGKLSESLEDKRERLFDKPLEVVTPNSNSNVLWQRHVDMMKVSKSTSYYNFLTDYDRQSCRACSHSKSCTSKHCKSCECGAKCDKHVINIDFLKYRPYDDVQQPSKTVSPPSNKLILKNNIAKYGLTMQGFTIMPKTRDMERKTLLSSHIDGEHCTIKPGHQKCLACAMAKENVLMQSNKRSVLFHPRSAPARITKLRFRKPTLT